MLPETEVIRLDELIHELREVKDDRCELLHEHLDTARALLWGAMPKEARMNIELALEQVDCISDVALREKTATILNHLLSEWT
jgi:hypothetical protein